MERKLQLVSGELLPQVPSRDKVLNIESKHYYRIFMNQDKTFAFFDLDTFVSPIPMELFQIKLSHRIQITCMDGIKRENLKKEAYSICDSVGGQISYLVSSISKELIGSHIVLPPHLNQKCFEEISINNE